MTQCKGGSLGPCRVDIPLVDELQVGKLGNARLHRLDLVAEAGRP